VTKGAEVAHVILVSSASLSEMIEARMLVSFKGPLQISHNRRKRVSASLDPNKPGQTIYRKRILDVPVSFELLLLCGTDRR